MLDVILIAAGCGCFALAIACAYACDRLWGDSPMMLEYVLGGA